MNVLVTGATGFVGPAVVMALVDRGHRVIAATRTGVPVAGAAEVRRCNDLRHSDLDDLVAGVDAVVHLAGIAHRHGVDASDHDATNHRVTVALAEAAAAAGAGHFVFMSTSKVHGELTDRPLRSRDPFAPEDAYAASKADAEQALARLCFSNPEFSVISLRPPVVYGADAKANLALIGALVERGLPIPRLLPEPKRAVISLPHLSAAVSRAVAMEQVGYAGYVLADRRPVTLCELAEASSTTAVRTIPVPAAIIRLLSGLAPLRRFRGIAVPFEIDNAEWERVSEISAWEPQLELLRPLPG